MSYYLIIAFIVKSSIKFYGAILIMQRLKFQIFIIVNYEGFNIWIETKQLKILCLKILKKRKVF